VARKPSFSETELPNILLRLCLFNERKLPPRKVTSVQNAMKFILIYDTTLQYHTSKHHPEKKKVMSSIKSVHTIK
jgi:hypothetical protein